VISVVRYQKLERRERYRLTDAERQRSETNIHRSFFIRSCLHLFENEAIYHCICKQNFPGSQGSCHGNQIWAIISQNCTDFSSVQEIEEFFRMNSKVFGDGEFKHGNKNFKEPRELPWQLNLGKNKPVSLRNSVR